MIERVFLLIIVFFCARMIRKNKINLWKFYNILTGANKSSYIDNFLDRSLDSTQLTEGIDRVLHGDNTYKWFIE